MKFTDLAIKCGIALNLALFYGHGVAHSQEVSDEGSRREAIEELLTKNCYDCHGNGESQGSLQLDDLLEQPDTPELRARWWKVLSNVRAGTMPPPDSGFKLEKNEANELLKWLKYSAMAIDADQPDPGRPTVRRLSRREYANSIRDLTGVDYNADVMFPPDDSGYGFDNIGDAQSLSLMILEKYLAAAKEIVDKAVPTVCKVIPRQGFQVDGLSRQVAREQRRQHAT